MLLGTAVSLRGRLGVWSAAAVALAIGLPVLLWGALGTRTPTLAWFVPVCDAVAVGCMAVVALLGSCDAVLRQNRRSLPIVFIATATAVLWAGHFATFPGDLPFVTGQDPNQATSTLFLTINLLTPLMLSVALLQRGGPLVSPLRDVFLMMGAGAVLASIAVALSLLLGGSISTVSASGAFNTADAVVGVAGLIPALIGLIAFASGLHGDERVAGGVLAALTFTGMSSLSLLFLQARYTPAWYADHILVLLPFLALIAGQLWLYTGSVIAERSASEEAASSAERRRIGLDIAEAMAIETDPRIVVGRLLTGVLNAVRADRVTMLRLVPQGFVVERSVDREGTSAMVGRILPLDSVVAGGRKVVAEALQLKRPLRMDAYHVDGIDEPGEHHARIRRSIVVPLVRGGVVDGMLVVGRRSDQRFSEADVDQLAELAAVATLLIRNARLLAESEANSRAKSSFINLAAHEFGTPIAVIRGYVEMLSDDTLNVDSHEQRIALQSIRSTSADLATRVEQLLIASRLEIAGSTDGPVSLPAVDLVDVVEEAVDRAGDRARLIDAQVSAAVPETPVVARANPHDVGIILDNLLSNAMTYSNAPAEVKVSVSDGREAEIRVGDHGIGIPEAAWEQIFDQFFRIDTLEFGYPAGTGLGLYISRRLAERNGGRLWLEQSGPAGSVFVLRLHGANP